ncbi:hypothetical protein LX87_04237 [Larkinella arboricola]|uniref:Uncharacterized protein n=2 Tax=Larkinella arboricola TaxID=643671 RepID=A0A327WR07_LARAB|nr:hypothetical protein LX87_04237 [Larkinella arboricola]
MKFIYGLFFIPLMACQSGQRENQLPSNAYRDLLIDRVVWEKGDSKNVKDTATNLHTFTLTNTSDAYAYRQIEVRFNYFDSTYHKIGSSQKILDKTIGPRAALIVGKIQDGKVQAGAKSSTVTIVNAVAERAEPEK